MSVKLRYCAVECSPFLLSALFCGGRKIILRLPGTSSGVATDRADTSLIRASRCGVRTHAGAAVRAASDGGSVGTGTYPPAGRDEYLVHARTHRATHSLTTHTQDR